MNLHELAPEFFSEGETVDFDLEKIYKQRSASSHLDALETIFEKGFEYALGTVGNIISAQNQDQLSDLQEKFDALTRKHEMLKAQVGAKVPADVMTEGGQMDEIRAQALGMGVVFRS
jgi:hypothetical protein